MRKLIKLVILHIIAILTNLFACNTFVHCSIIYSFVQIINKIDIKYLCSEKKAFLYIYYVISLL